MSKKNTVEEEAPTEFQFFDLNQKGHILIKKIQKATEIMSKKFEGHKRKRKYSKIKKQRGNKTPPPSKK